MTPESELRVSGWISTLRDAAAGSGGEADSAAQKLWERYFERLARRVDRKFLPGGDGDGQDVALSVLVSFFRGASAGRFPQLADPHTLWPLLVVMAARKVYDRVEKRETKKRGGGWTNVGAEALEQVMGRTPSPELSAELDDECRRRLDALDEVDTAHPRQDERLHLRQIALWKLEGYTSAEIAARLECDETTVALRLGLIRRRWRTDEGDA